MNIKEKVNITYEELSDILGLNDRQIDKVYSKSLQNECLDNCTKNGTRRTHEYT